MSDDAQEILDWMNAVAPYCAEPADGWAWALDKPKCPARPHASCQCDAKPDHEGGQYHVQHHICQCGRAWKTEPRRKKTAPPPMTGGGA